MNFKLSNESYTIRNALLWGNCIGHFKEACQGNLGKRVVHAMVAILELFPIVSQVISIAEKILVHNLFAPKNHSSSLENEVKTEDSSSKQIILINTSNALNQEDLLSRLPFDISNLVIAFLDLKDFPTIANVCKKWLGIQRQHVAFHCTKNLSFYKTTFQTRCNKELWKQYVKELPSRDKGITQVNQQIINKFFANILLEEIQDPSIYQIIREKADLYFDQFLMNKHIHMRYVLVVLSLICKFDSSISDDWIKQKINLLLTRTNRGRNLHELTSLIDNSFCGWAIPWTEHVGGDEVEDLPLGWIRSQEVLPRVISLYAQELMGQICQSCRNSQNKELHLHFTGDYPTNPNQQVVVPLLKALKNLPEKIKHLDLFARTSVFTDKNADDIAEIIKTSPQLSNIRINISQMTDESRKKIHLPQNV